MSKSTLLGLAAAAVVIGACSGEIGGLSSDLGPGSPRNGDLTATLSVSNGSRTVEATEKAYDTLELELFARPGGSKVDAGIAVASEKSADLSQAPIRIRFGEDGFIDVQDGGQWTNSTVMPYEAYVWYRIKISADVATETYAVEVEPQYDVKAGAQQPQLRTLVDGARFDSRTQREKWLSVWGAWSSNDYTLDIAKPSWFASGRCAPASCESLGAQCGVLDDGCGGTLSCGVCGTAEACRGGTCADLCVPETCVSLGVECGSIDDGCGGTLTCGACGNGETCTEGLCVADACVPDTCVSLGVECGAVDDGCGGSLSCGGCASGSACVGGVCEPVCTPATCASWGVECGTLDDGCGGTLNCGGCPSGEVCGYGACVSISLPPPSCTPDSCQSLGVACGAASDGCGGTLSCGGCGSGQTCVQGRCQSTCTPRTCASVGAECGTVSDGCGGTLRCGSCASGQACNAGVCEALCVSDTCLSLGVECGAASNGCGGSLSCGGCAVGQVCDAGACVAASPPSCSPYTCGEIGASCGNQSDGCGGTLSCGSCPSGSACSSGQCVAAGSKTFFASRTKCMAPCAVQLDAQKGGSLSWPDVRDSEFLWDFDDGGSRTDADGFLAAVVYELPGTYHPTVTVNGETWNSQTITVTAPAQTRCVSLASNWTGCPAGASHHTSVSSALSGLSSGTHVLFHRGESYGSQNLGGYANVAFGAYGTGTKPSFTSGRSWDAAAGTTWMDLQFSGSDPDNGVRVVNGNDALLLRVTGRASSDHFFYAEDGAFIVQSDLTGGLYGMYLANTPYLVVKDSTISRSVGGEHTIRQQGGDRSLYQNNQIIHATGNGFKTSLQIRGDSNWALVQGNFMNQTCAVNPQNNTENELQQHVVWERNVLDATNSYTQWGMRFIGHDMIVRNNVTFNNSQFHFKADSHPLVSTQNIWFVNNTAFTSKSGADGVVCGGSGCVNKNNLFYSTQSAGTCFSGGTRANNWCETVNVCVDPVTGNSGCYEPSFMSLDPNSPDFARPGAGARGIDAGDANVPVWNDFNNADRLTSDVGAVAI